MNYLPEGHWEALFGAWPIDMREVVINFTEVTQYFQGPTCRLETFFCHWLEMLWASNHFTSWLMNDVCV